jgi:hypothetical protein
MSSDGHHQSFFPTERRVRAGVIGRAARRCAFLAGAIAALASGAACIGMAAMWTNITGGDWIDAEFELTKAPLLIFIDDRSGLVNDPHLFREVHNTIADNFLHFDVNKSVIPFQEWQRLQSEPGFERMSIRQIGEKLGAEQVLYLGVDHFTLNTEDGAPILRGKFDVRVKVLSTERKERVRLWPQAQAGQKVSVETDPKPIDEDTRPADVVRELGIKMGQEVSLFFYGRREFAT